MFVMTMDAGARFVLVAEAWVVALAVFFIVFALAVVWVAFWYHLRQDKQVRMDEDEQDFVMRPGEEDDADDEDARPRLLYEQGQEEGGDGDDDEDVEPGMKRFRHA